MKRFFYDLAANTYIQHDWRGREFRSLDDARDLAELIALDLECTDEGEWVGAEIRVYNVRGDRLFSVPVKGLSQVAA